jgi:hypothetical protein
MNGPTLANVRAVLVQLGFNERSVPGQYYRFEHQLPDTWVLLPPYKDDDIVSDFNVANIRILLDYRGLMKPADFEEALRDRSLAG